MSLLVAGRDVVVVGQGVDERTSALRAAGARVRVVLPSDYTRAHCAGAFAVLAFGRDAAHNRAVAADARAAGCLCYAHDAPDVSDFALPAVARRGPLSVAVATDGTAPALAGRLRRELQALVDGAGDALDAFLSAMAARRAALAPGQRRSVLVAMARRLAIAGKLVIGPDDSVRPADGDRPGDSDGPDDR